MKYLLLLPFLNAFVLFICLNQGQILYKHFEWLKNNVFPWVPINNKLLGGCILCTSFWIGVIALCVFIITHMEYKNDLSLLFFLPYNAVLTDILYKQLKK